MCCVTGETQDRGTHRKNGITRRRSNSRGRIHQFLTEKKNERHSCGVNQKQAQMNSGDCLSEDRHEQSVGGISPRELHVVSQLIWRNTLQHQLTRISVLSFIPLEWNSEEPNSDRERQAKNRECQNRPCDAQGFVVDIDHVCHGKCYSGQK